jgi:hypothetical protein
MATQEMRVSTHPKTWATNEPAGTTAR